MITPTARRSWEGRLALREHDSAKLASVAAAIWIAHLAQAAIAARGQCTMALSGGRTPADLLRALAIEPVLWQCVHIFQVDERVTPYSDPNRNLVQLQRAFRSKGCSQVRIHAMPVDEGDLQRAAMSYGSTLEAAAGRPPVLDIVHLGLGADGHMASLVPGHPGLDETRRNVAATASYQGYRRLTLTLPCLARARALVWLVTGSEKAEALARWVDWDPLIPASRLPRETSTVFVDRAAAAKLEHLR